VVREATKKMALIALGPVYAAMPDTLRRSVSPPPPSRSFRPGKLINHGQPKHMHWQQTRNLEGGGDGLKGWVIGWVEK